MRISDFDLYRDLLKKQSGLIITPDKSYLLDSRLTPVARKWGYVSLDSMSMALRGMPDPEMVRDVTEAMSNNETSFFRDKTPFETFETLVLPYLIKSRKKRHELRIWSNACSTGQEAFSLAILLKENEEALKHLSPTILATDISIRALRKAETATFSQFDSQRGLPIRHLIKYFEKSEDKWVLKDELRDMVELAYFNLLDNMSSLGKFDVIFCRNVLIYFDEETRRTVLERLADRMPDDGFLFLGGAETVMGITDRFKPMDGYNGLYVPQDTNTEKLKTYAQAIA